ncbi:MAG: hypothetical protein AVDCRST_MAG05-518 [uncultured Rubrobacteraceae bacterium]|uniref:Uncharacterized protein n=1 Tax=uncultured Rubrobacteraceae bacterium TaxID=349277 RepID=A0A6J4RL38_9ACTN|nr:MAG: hypothetical protein AVDCRST_MAG05-518 [uncultured Rubrobacteraceae bacterium]
MLMLLDRRQSGIRRTTLLRASVYKGSGLARGAGHASLVEPRISRYRVGGYHVVGSRRNSA